MSFQRIVPGIVPAFFNGGGSRQRVFPGAVFFNDTGTFVPPAPGKSGSAPGRNKSPTASKYQFFVEMQQRDRARKTRRFATSAIAFLPQSYTPPTPEQITWRDRIKIVKLN